MDLDELIGMASSIIHEACHVYRYRAGLESGGYVGEKACLTIQIEATAQFDTAGHQIWMLRDLLKDFDDPARQWWRRDCDWTGHCTISPHA